MDAWSTINCVININELARHVTSHVTKSIALSKCCQSLHYTEAMVATWCLIVSIIWLTIVVAKDDIYQFDKHIMGFLLT